VKIQHQRLEAAHGKAFRRALRQGRWSMDSTTACMHESKRASFWTFTV